MSEIIWTDYAGLSDEDINEELTRLSHDSLKDQLASLEDGIILVIEAKHE